MTSFNDDSPPLGGLRLERLPQVMARTGLKRATLYRMIALGEFPRQVPLGERASAWVADEVTAFIASRVALRDQGAKR